MIADIKQGDVLNHQELALALHIGRATLNRNEERILQELKECYDYEIKYTKTGRKSLFHFIKKLDDYEYITYSKNTVKKNKVYKPIVLAVLHQQPLNTAANIARIILKDNQYSIAVKEFTESSQTIQKDVLRRLNQWFGNKPQDDDISPRDRKIRLGRVVRSTWAMIDKENNVYIELSWEQKQQLDSLLDTHVFHNKDSKKWKIDILTEFQTGNITQKQMRAQCGEVDEVGFYSAFNDFKRIYGMPPVRVKLYEVFI